MGERERGRRERGDERERGRVVAGVFEYSMSRYLTGRACVRTCVRAYVLTCVRACVRVGLRAKLCVCVIISIGPNAQP